MSFSFYIPHKRPKLGGHISTQISYTPSPAPLQRSCAESNSEDSKKRRSYGTSHGVLLSWYCFAQCSFTPLYTPWIAWNTRLQLNSELIHHTRFWHLLVWATRVTWFQCLCISRNMNLSIRFVYELLWDYSHFGFLICVFSWLSSPDGSHETRIGLNKRSP